MKKFLVVLLTIALVATFAVGCNSSSTSDDPVTYTDGVYFAQEDVFAAGSGYKYFVVVTVADGQVTDAYWGGTNVQPNGNKRTASEEGTYGMVAYGSAAADWYKQAEAAEAWLVENQDPAKFEEFYTDDAGHTEELTTDDGTQVSIHVIEFFELAKAALAGEPVAEGTYTTPDDYVATAALPVDGDWEYKGEFVVVNGTVVSSNLNAIFAGELTDDTAKYYATDAEGNADDTAPLSKKELGEAYGMDWAGNAEKADAFVVESQGFAVEYSDDEGHTDSIAGVSIHVSEFEELFKSALGE
ncbi:MAG: hypothetical protein ACOWWH_10160 [Eubacteriaceae bacterium]